MRRKTNVLGDLEKLLESLAQEIKQLKSEQKKLKARVEKIFPSKPGRPPKNLVAMLMAGGLALFLGFAAYHPREETGRTRGWQCDLGQQCIEVKFGFGDRKDGRIVVSHQ